MNKIDTKKEEKKNFKIAKFSVLIVSIILIGVPLLIQGLGIYMLVKLRAGR